MIHLNNRLLEHTDSLKTLRHTDSLLATHIDPTLYHSGQNFFIVALASLRNAQEPQRKNFFLNLFVVTTAVPYESPVCSDPRDSYLLTSLLNHRITL
jgi:hypothetical protein